MSARKSASGVSYAEDDDSSLSSISSDRDSDAEDEQGTDLLVPLPSDAAPSSAPHEITSSWEVAYVYAFLVKFTDVHSTTNARTLLPSISALEEALIACSPTEPEAGEASEGGQNGKGVKMSIEDLEPAVPAAPAVKEGLKAVDEKVVSLAPASPVSSLSSVDDSDTESKPDPVLPKLPAPTPVAVAGSSSLPTFPPVPSSSLLLIAIIDALKANLFMVATAKEPHPVNKRTWFPWLEDWVDRRFGADGVRKLQWDQNHLSGHRGTGDLQYEKDREEQRFWNLAWEDKIHVLRVIVDWSLSESTQIKAKLEQHYQMSKQRPAKRIASENSLVIEPLGHYDAPGGTKRQVWALDKSARLYECNMDGTDWRSRTDSIESYTALLQSLPIPVALARQSDDGLFDMFRRKPQGAAASPSKGKGKGKEKEVKVKVKKSKDGKASLDAVLTAGMKLRQTLKSRLALTKSTESDITTLLSNRAALEAEIIAKDARAKAAQIAKKAAEKEKARTRAARVANPSPQKEETVEGGYGRTGSRGKNYNIDALIDGDLFEDGSEEEEEVEKKTRKGKQRRARGDDSDEQEFQGSGEEGEGSDEEPVEAEDDAEHVPTDEDDEDGNPRRGKRGPYKKRAPPLADENGVASSKAKSSPKVKTSSTSSAKRAKKAAPAASGTMSSEWKGERRSSRQQLREGRAEDVDAVDEVAVDAAPAVELSEVDELAADTPAVGTPVADAPLADEAAMEVDSVTEGTMEVDVPTTNGQGRGGAPSAAV